MRYPSINLLMPKQAILEEKICETEDTCSLKISLLDKGRFSFKPGQFNMLGVPGFGEAPFSISSLAIGDKTFIHTIRLAGNVTKRICELGIGEKLSFRGPYGNGWPLDKATGKYVVIVGGGIGIAPLRPVIYHILQKRKKFGKLFVLYGARTEDDMLYRKELKDWSELDGISVLLSVDEKPKTGLLDTHVGVVTTLIDKIDIPLSEAVSFICGPEIMMRFVARDFILRGQSANNIFLSMERRMNCGIAHCGHCQIGAKYVCKDGPVFAYADIRRFADTLL